MKKLRMSIMPVLTVLFLAFTLGIFLYRNTHRPDVEVTYVAQGSVSTSPLSVLAGQIEAPIVININTASREQLMTLPGIGETLADRILAYRRQNGPFRTPEELLNVEGIGKEKLAIILNYITLSGG